MYAQDPHSSVAENSCSSSGVNASHQALEDKERSGKVGTGAAGGQGNVGSVGLGSGNDNNNNNNALGAGEAIRAESRAAAGELGLGPGALKALHLLRSHCHLPVLRYELIPDINLRYSGSTLSASRMGRTIGPDHPLIRASLIISLIFFSATPVTHKFLSLPSCLTSPHCRFPSPQNTLCPARWTRCVSTVSKHCHLDWTHPPTPLWVAMVTTPIAVAPGCNVAIVTVDWLSSCSTATTKACTAAISTFTMQAIRSRTWMLQHMLPCCPFCAATEEPNENHSVSLERTNETDPVGGRVLAREQNVYRLHVLHSFTTKSTPSNSPRDVTRKEE